MNRQDAEEFTQSLGQIVGGSYRQIRLAERLGVPKALGLRTEQWVLKYLGGYVRLNAEQRQRAYEELKAEDPDISKRAIAKATGISRGTVDREVPGPNGPPRNDMQLLSQALTTEGGPNGPPDRNFGTERKAGEDARKAVLERPSDPEILPGIYAEDFFTGSERIAEASVDLVFTDPPYDKDSVDLYRKAANVAARILKPGGSFVAYSGQKYLPEVYGLINHPALKYWWTFAGVHAGGNQMLQKLGVRCGWKPIVWYVKGTRGDVSGVLSDVITGAREKDHHEWQQSEAEALHFIEKLTFEGGLVVDFFLGGGTTKVAADRLGRRFIGFEIDTVTASRARARITGAQAA